MKRRFNRKYKPVELWMRVHEYFQEMEKKKEEPTRAGLCLYLEVGESTWQNMCKRAEFKEATDYALLKLQEVYEKRLAYDKNPTGAIFGLKNMGWSDNGKLNVSMNTDLTLEQVVKDGKMKA